MTEPTTIIGIPLYNGARHLQESLESILSQTRPDIAVIIVDDASTDGSDAIAMRYARLDHRVRYHRNERRLGMIANWRHAFDLGLGQHPRASYFAWGSDHDLWHPRWHERLVAVLEERPEAVLAYPLTLGIDESGKTVRQSWRFDCGGVTDARERLRLTVKGMAAGGMVYGLFRADILRKCGVFRPALLPDRLLLSEASLHGQFLQVPETLWFRRYREGVRPSLNRQRASFFPDSVPGHAYLPWPFVHAALLFNALVRENVGPSGRLRGLTYTLSYLRLALDFETRRKGIRLRKRLGWRRRKSASLV